MTAIQVPQHAGLKKKRRVFLWVFLGIQAVFIVWLILAGVAVSGAPGISPGELASDCGNGQWHVLYQSYGACADFYRNLAGAGKGIGAGIGFALIVGFWMVTDFLVGGGYAVYRLAKRRTI